MGEVMDTHKNKILNFLRETNGGLTSWEAITHFRCTRLAARIADLKDDGFRIETTMERNEIKGTRYARYFLLGER
jgi:hypothetical protein